MLWWLIAGSIAALIVGVMVLRDAIGDDRQRKLSKNKSYTDY